jgi:CheY-like chemotaxis protein
MLHAPIHLYHSQRLIQASEQLMDRIETRLAQAREAITRGKARASVTDEGPVGASNSYAARQGETMAPQPPLRILVIDDEPSVVSAITRLLRNDGYTVDTADNGHGALSQLQERRYDALLCDLRMPELDGPTFYDILSRQHAYLRQRVLFLTGDSLGTDSTAFLEQCGQPWVYKPCNAAEVRSALQQMLHAMEVSE